MGGAWGAKPNEAHEVSEDDEEERKHDADADGAVASAVLHHVEACDAAHRPHGGGGGTMGGNAGCSSFCDFHLSGGLVILSAEEIL